MSRLFQVAIALLAIITYGVRYFVKKRNESKDLVSTIQRVYLLVKSGLKTFD